MASRDTVLLAEGSCVAAVQPRESFSPEEGVDPKRVYSDRGAEFIIAAYNGSRKDG